MLRRTPSFPVLALFVVLVGCRDAGGSATPDEASPAAAGDAAPSEPAKAEAPAEPAEPAEPSAQVTVQGRIVEARMEERAAATADAPPTQVLVARIGSATLNAHEISLTMGDDPCERAEAVVEPVSGEPSPLVLVQAFCDRGEDEFSREILSAVIDVGDAATAPRTLWKGKGSYRRSFDACEVLDVPTAEVAAGTLRVQQWTETILHEGPDLPKVSCKPKKARKETLAEIAL